MVTPEWLTGTKSLPCKEVINDVFISFDSIFQSDMKCVLLKKKINEDYPTFFSIFFSITHTSFKECKIKLLKDVSIFLNNFESN